MKLNRKIIYCYYTFKLLCCAVLRLRRMFDEVDLPMCWPVEVNYHEAKAYCAWRRQDFRLLTEAEYYALRAPSVTWCHYFINNNNNNNNICLLKIDKPQLNTEMLKVKVIHT